MTEEVINGLPSILNTHICTMKKASNDSGRGECMTNSLLKVVDYDKITKEYSRGKGWSCVPCSNDVLYVTSERKWFFVEFKNGSIDKSNIFRKIYDSLIMLMELGVIPDFQFIRENINYILVYNSDKYPRVQNSESRNENYTYLLKLAQTERKLFEIEKFEGYLFNETHTYDKFEFDKLFIEPMEKQEGALRS